MQGDLNVDLLMLPVLHAIERHVKDRDAITDIYNRAYEAVLEVQDALNVSAAVTAKQIAENAKNLQRAALISVPMSRSGPLEKRMAPSRSFQGAWWKLTLSSRRLKTRRATS